VEAPVVHIVEHHHHVLPYWAQYRRTLRNAPRLITLDFHTDTSKPFRHFLRTHYPGDPAHVETLRKRWIQSIDFRDPASITSILEKLNNDEHVVAAIQSDIISSAFVIAHSARDTDQAVYNEHRICCRAVDRDPNSQGATRAECDRVLESAFLDEMVLSFNQFLDEIGELRLDQSSYILDIDLDYLNTFRAAAPDDAATLRQLAQHAGIITIATEPGYVAHCARDVGLNSDDLLDALVKLIS